MGTLTRAGSGRWVVMTDAALRRNAEYGPDTAFVLEGRGPVTTDLSARIAAFQRKPLTAPGGTRVAVLVAGETALGTAGLFVYDGSVETWGGERVLRLLRNHTQAYRVEALDVLDWLPASKSAPAELVARFEAATAGLPATRSLTQADLEGATPDHPAAVLWTHGAVPGCIWLVDGFDGAGNVSGWLWVPGASDLEAEHRSIWFRELLQAGAFITATPNPVAAPWSLPETFAGVWARLFDPQEVTSQAA